MLCALVTCYSGRTPGTSSSPARGKFTETVGKYKNILLCESYCDTIGKWILLKSLVDYELYFWNPD
jgi:hypothetical protein